jgi:hypothetical protein
MKKKINFFLILLLTAGIWWNLFNIKNIILEWKDIPNLVKNNLSLIFSLDNQAKLYEVRWNAFGMKKENILSKIFYNKGYILVDNLFSFLSYTSPRMYFQAGDGTRFSPPNVEPLAGILFPFWVIGIIFLIKKNKFKPIVLTLLFSFLAFLIGIRTFAFLLPILIIYTFIASEVLNKKYLIFIVSYLIFIIGRVIWLKS